MRSRHDDYNPAYKDLPDDSESYQELRSAWAIGFARASEISGLAIEAILPALGGVWLDTKFETTPLWVLTGALLGLTTAGFHLLHFIKKLGHAPKHKTPKD